MRAAKLFNEFVRACNPHSIMWQVFLQKDSRARAPAWYDLTGGRVRGVVPGGPRPEEDIKKPRVAAFGACSACELAVGEEGYDGTFDPAWGPIPRRAGRCPERCEKRSARCQLRGCHQGVCASRRCLMSHVGSIQSHRGAMAEEQTEQMAGVSGQLYERGQRVPRSIHCDY